MKYFEESCPILFVRSVDGKGDLPLWYFPEGVPTSVAKEIIGSYSGIKLYHVAEFDENSSSLRPGQKVFIRASKTVGFVSKNYSNRILLSTGRSYNKNEICTLREVTFKEGAAKEKRKPLRRVKDVILLKEESKVAIGRYLPTKLGRNVEFTCGVSFFTKGAGKNVQFDSYDRFGVDSTQVVHDSVAVYTELYTGKSDEDLELFLKKGKGEALIRALNK